MRDLNFFEPFLDKKQIRFNKMVILYFLLLASMIGLSVLAGLNQVKINSLKNDVNSLAVVANNPQTLQKIEEINAFEQEVARFRTEVDNIRSLDASIKARDVIREDLLYDINTRLPMGVFLTNMRIVGKDIQLTGYAEDQYSIAEFGKGLEVLENANEVFISNISSVESYYKFDLNLILKEVLVNVN